MASCSTERHILHTERGREGQGQRERERQCGDFLGLKNEVESENKRAVFAEVGVQWRRKCKTRVEIHSKVIQVKNGVEGGGYRKCSIAC